MPRSGPPSYTYTLPPIYLAIPGTTITAAQHNDPLEDIASTFNSVQPVVWGGTGSANAAGARSNLGAAGVSVTNTFTANQIIRLADDTAAAGPLLTLDRNSASPAASDVIGEVVFSGRDSGAGTQTYGLVGAEIVDATAAAEGGRVLLQTVIAGTLADRVYVGAGIYTAGATGGDKGADSVNAASYYMEGISTLPNGFLYGAAISNNGVDATNDIDFAAGKAVDSTNTSIAVLSAMTKRLDANWAAGTNQGMRYSGAAIANTTYHLYAAWKAGGVDADWYADPSATAATALSHLQAESGGSDYAYVRRVGSIVRSGGTILAFIQTGDTFVWSVPVNNVNAAPLSTSAQTATLTVPTGITVDAIFSGGVAQGGSAGYLLFTSLAQTDTTPTSSVYDIAGQNNEGFGVPNNAEYQRMTNTSAQIRYRCDTTDADFIVVIVTRGWVDTRGRLA